VTAAQPAPTRVCPHCSTLAATAEKHCPWCGRGYRRRSSLPGIAALLALAVAAVLGGVALMLVQFGDQLDRELDESVTVVQRDLDRDVRRLERRITRQVDQIAESLAAPPIVP